jgi:hypothetical protein
MFVTDLESLNLPSVVGTKSNTNKKSTIHSAANGQGGAACRLIVIVVNVVIVTNIIIIISIIIIVFSVGIWAARSRPKYVAQVPQATGHAGLPVCRCHCRSHVLFQKVFT